MVTTDMTTSFERAWLESLLTWYVKARRDLPWRRTRDPYAIVVSELMLQQTQVATVIPYYERWMARFPTFEALAGADEAEVLKMWSGLGYYARARHLHALAREVVARCGGRLPASKTELRKLPGIGDYTAGAVLSIAYDQPEPAVDGNVRRVAARLFGWETPVDASSFSRQVYAALKPAYAALSPPHSPGDLTQALMELGATVCTPRRPNCAACPLHTHCAALRLGLTERLPMRKKPQAKRKEKRAVWILQAKDGTVRVERRGTRLLRGMWQFPNWPSENLPEVLGAVPLDQVPPPFDLAPSALDGFRAERVGTVEHVFTHLIWSLDVYHVAEAPKRDWPLSDAAEGGDWLLPEAVEALPLAGPFRKAFHLWRTR
ncbi:MAG: A/G-specific adenine glycosylase [Hydrogenibacillus sp.]|nr:A/G-specific adenine glycosylase [Hydrogenibacillus sp.]